jgi:hypothetical protein
VRECATGEFQEPVADAWYFAGLDLAKVEDYTVLVILNEKFEVVHLDRFHRLDWSMQVQRIKTAIERFNRAALHVDSTGGARLHSS